SCLLSSPPPPLLLLTPPPPTPISSLSLHDALPISLDVVAADDVEDDVDALSLGRRSDRLDEVFGFVVDRVRRSELAVDYKAEDRSEEHTSELQSLRHLVCRLLLEKKKKKKKQLQYI